MPGPAGMCLLPSLCFRRTAFVATGVLSYAANMFARFLLGALLAGVLWKHLDVFAVSPVLSRRVGDGCAIQAACGCRHGLDSRRLLSSVSTAWRGCSPVAFPAWLGDRVSGAWPAWSLPAAQSVAPRQARRRVAGGVASGGVGRRPGLAALHRAACRACGEAARAIYAGVQAGAHGQNLGTSHDGRWGAIRPGSRGRPATHPQPTDAGVHGSSTTRPMAARGITKRRRDLCLMTCLCLFGVLYGLSWVILLGGCPHVLLVPNPSPITGEPSWSLMGVLLYRRLLRPAWPGPALSATAIRADGPDPRRSLS